MVRRARKKIPKFESLEELNLVPYLDVMMNLIIFMMVTISAYLPLGILSIFPPAASSSGTSAQQQNQEDQAEKLGLSLFITHEGFTFAALGGSLPLIPKTQAGDYDWAALTNATADIKDRFPAERMIIVTADKDIKYGILIRAMDAVRNKGDKLLFDNVLLSPGLLQ